MYLFWNFDNNYVLMNVTINTFAYFELIAMKSYAQNMFAYFELIAMNIYV